MEEILVLGLNPAWQRMFALPELVLGGVHRLPHARSYASGKGVNCARVLQALGTRACCAHFLGGANGLAIRDELSAVELEQLVVVIAAGTRVCTTLAVPDSGTLTGSSTELIEPSPVVLPAESQKLHQELRARWDSWRRILVCGSFPPGFDGSALAGLPVQSKLLYIDAVQGVDFWMRQGVELLKVNTSELRAIFLRLGLSFPAGENPWRMVARSLRTVWPVRTLVVTEGAAGAYAVDASERVWHVAVDPSVRLRNAIGAGDSFFAGWVQAAALGETVAQCLCAAMATAQARCEVDLPWEFKRERREALWAFSLSVIQELP